MNLEQAKQQPYWLITQRVVNHIRASGLLEKSFGQCLSMSDIVLKLLYAEGIKSELVECSLMVRRKNPPGVYLVGYPGFIENQYNKDERIQNHVVCITNTEVPILIDLSINSIDGAIDCICEPIVQEEEHADLAEFVFENSTWTYQKRPITGLPKLYERTILRRMETEAKLEKEIKFIKIFLFVMFTVSFLNFARGLYDFYLTFISK